MSTAGAAANSERVTSDPVTSDTKRHRVPFRVVRRWFPGSPVEVQTDVTGCIAHGWSECWRNVARWLNAPETRALREDRSELTVQALRCGADGHWESTEQRTILIVRVAADDWRFLILSDAEVGALDSPLAIAHAAIVYLPETETRRFKVERTIERRVAALRVNPNWLNEYTGDDRSHGDPPAARHRPDLALVPDVPALHKFSVSRSFRGWQDVVLVVETALHWRAFWGWFVHWLNEPAVAEHHLATEEVLRVASDGEVHWIMLYATQRTDGGIEWRCFDIPPDCVHLVEATRAAQDDPDTSPAIRGDIAAATAAVRERYRRTQRADWISFLPGT